VTRFGEFSPIGRLFALGSIDYVLILTKFGWAAFWAQWTSHPTQEQKTRVQIPPGYKVFRKNMAVLLCDSDK
jgi:hypothetical protein